MNIFKKLIAISLIFMITLGLAQAYDPTEKDFDIVDAIEENIYNKIDNNKNITAEAVIKIIENIQENKELNERITTIFDIIIEDIRIDYLEDYSYAEEDDYELTRADCYEGELFDEEEKYCYIEVYEDEDLSDVYFDENFIGN
jgi:hypothetical protein